MVANFGRWSIDIYMYYIVSYGRVQSVVQGGNTPVAVKFLQCSQYPLLCACCVELLTVWQVLEHKPVSVISLLDADQQALLLFQQMDVVQLLRLVAPYLL